MNFYQQIIDQYTLSQRKEITFRKIYSSHNLNKDQVDRLKTAESIYECIPLTIYLPFSVYFLRLVGRANTGRRLLNFIGQLAIIVPTVECGARWQRDKLYWPIVQEVYRELK